MLIIPLSDRVVALIQGGTAEQTIVLPVSDSITTLVSIMRMANTAENQVQ